jgi:putative resolvase
MKNTLSIGEAATMLGCSITTLRRWHKSDKLIPQFHTFGGHRRYHIQQILNIIHPNKNNENRINIGYARVSSHDQKKDLETQKERLENYGKKHKNFEVISDLGSGLNYKKKGLKNLINMICQSKIDNLVLIHKDRLLRFGSEIIFQLCAYYGTNVIILEDVEKTFEEELTCDVIELMTVFSARLYGKRSHKNRKNVELAKAA